MQKLTTFVAATALSLMGGASLADGLELEIFVSEPNEINVTSALIMGPTEMMVMSAQGTRSSAERLADLIDSKGLDLEYIFLSHPHLDHSQGASVLLERFPDAKFISTPEIAAVQTHRIPIDDAAAAARHKENALTSIPAEPYEGDTIEIDGHTIEIWKDLVGDVGIAEPDEPHVALHIPSLNALLPSDIVYYNAHVFLGGSTKESREIWKSQIEDWLARDFDIVVPGHMLKTDLDNLTAEGALTHTLDYLNAYEPAIADSNNSEELIGKMLAIYPDMQHQSALYIGSWINFKEMRNISFNPAAAQFPEGASEEEIQRIDAERYEAFKKAYNLD
ncbi:MBL fold metallo-hydrolase [Ruegeria jejuensis]|uniref:MBL fold metallo-hydrolase n=1 Tax=Ruegeria jejuensis TaxID=3233338 RepID=UPI00355C90E3